MRQTPSTCVIALFATLLVASVQAACRVEPRGEVPLVVTNGLILATVQVNDIAAIFILDTGAARTLMGEDAVRDLGLDRDDWVASTVRGIGGLQQRPNALPRSLRLGAATLRRKTLTGDTSVTVGPLPVKAIGGQAVAGLLGRDFLAPFDLDLDLPGRLLTLYDVHGCNGRFLPWRMPHVAIPPTSPAGTAQLEAPLFADVQLDGRPLRALIDTGASASLVTATGMFRLGLTAAALDDDTGASANGVGPKPVPMRRHRFAELRVGTESTAEPIVWVAPVRVVPVADILLGMDWLGSRRVWLSFATKQVFVASKAGNGR